MYKYVQSDIALICRIVGKIGKHDKNEEIITPCNGRGDYYNQHHNPHIHYEE